MALMPMHNYGYLVMSVSLGFLLLGIASHYAFYSLSLQVYDSQRYDSAQQLLNRSLTSLRLQNIASSVCCQGDSLLTKVCSFRYVCYQDNGRKLLHLYNESSVTSNPLMYIMAVDKFPQAAVHVVLHRSPEVPHNNTFIQHDCVILMRFKPDNLMHVIHDDILPLYNELTKRYGERAQYPIQLVFADSHGIMPYDHLYLELSAFPLLYLTESDNLTCFRQLLAGSDRTTLWYQYGFHSHQGPLPHTQKLVQRAISSYVLRSIKPTSIKRQKNIVLFSRSETRLILNEEDLILSLANLFGRSIISLSLESWTLQEIAHVLSNAALVIGMHGAMLMTSIFMPLNATLLELFPYAIEPTHYSAYKTLCSIRGVNYLSWVNNNPRNTVGHPDYPRQYGGLEHLSAQEQDSIKSADHVDRHACCEDPSWLYHIYQDTVVDVEQIVQLLRMNIPHFM